MESYSTFIMKKKKASHNHNSLVLGPLDDLEDRATVHWIKDKFT